MASLMQLLVLVLVSGISYTFSDQIDITVKPGQEAILPCRLTNSGLIKVVDWTRNDLGSDSVLLYRSPQFVTDQQHESFKNRVDLKDRQMKNGDASLVLKNVAPEDRGTYKCQVIYKGANNMNLNHVYIINLDITRGSRMVSSRGSRAGSSGPVIGLAVLLLLLLFTD
ncbi:coxsackievirus and adenovirus receptor homolog [Poecilia formosa]|uniref:coxsackievirus and adenovirus receptor homolog n=1 Tax=Poecilia formosa TaxID=48698 RepID=UPI000444266C|nr:PREDICTED: coxsackievirus and adenovirus receptor homolog [Poecilia formosa]